MRKTVCMIITVLTLFYVYGVAGGLELELMSFEGALIRFAAALVVLAAAICASDPTNRKPEHHNPGSHSPRDQ